MKSCQLQILNSTGLILLLLGDEPRTVGVGVVLITMAVFFFLKDSVRSESVGDPK